MAALEVLTGWGFSTTQQPSLCQKSLMLAVVAASVPPCWHSCRDPRAGSLHGHTWGHLVEVVQRGEEQLAASGKGG